jgi:precorrin-3B C17-methyltransferase / cobalt-factor III methyltransferase
MIRVVGIGPCRGDMTIRAIQALEESDVIIGYGGYINQIKDLLDNKEIISKGMGQELERAELAIKYSKQGLKVALVSSGDPGVYGMANVLYQISGKYSDIEVEVIPGVTAVNYSASLLGAPLHDFSVISLSDILTPLSEIKRKVWAAATADFVIAFYNPRSKKRIKPFREALKILKNIRKPNTPIGLVKNGKMGTKVNIITLRELSEEEIDMNTTLIVGNTFTYIDDGNMITPRGYVIPHAIHPLALEFYEKYLAGERNEGSNTGCEFYPCHHHPQNCTFCYCPFYPCGDPSTGGYWLKEKQVWSCEGCVWIHQDDTVRCIQGKLPRIMENVFDLQDKKKELLKLRRECVFRTK